MNTAIVIADVVLMAAGGRWIGKRIGRWLADRILPLR